MADPILGAVAAAYMLFLSPDGNVVIPFDSYSACKAASGQIADHLDRAKGWDFGFSSTPTRICVLGRDKIVVTKAPGPVCGSAEHKRLLRERQPDTFVVCTKHKALRLLEEHLVNDPDELARLKQKYGID